MRIFKILKRIYYFFYFLQVSRNFKQKKVLKLLLFVIHPFLILIVFFSQERLILFFPAQMIISVNYLNIINNNLFQEPNITLNNYPRVNARVNWNTKK